MDGNEKLQLDSPNPLCFNIYNNKLYFLLAAVNNLDSLYTINVSNLDGTNRKELYRGYNLFNLGAYENSIYFVENHNLKKMDISSPSLIQSLPIKSNYYNIIQYSIYFSNNSDSYKLYKSDLGGLLISKICDDNAIIISVIDDWLYYYTGKHLYRIKQDGTGRQLVD